MSEAFGRGVALWEFEAPAGAAPSPGKLAESFAQSSGSGAFGYEGFGANVGGSPPAPTQLAESFVHTSGSGVFGFDGFGAVAGGSAPARSGIGGGGSFPSHRRADRPQEKPPDPQRERIRIESERALIAIVNVLAEEGFL